MTKYGAYYTVIESGKSRGNEDMGYYADWYCWARMRPATEAEATACAKRREEQARKATLASIPEWIERQVKTIENYCRGDERIPADAWTFRFRSAFNAALHLADGHLWVTECPYDDGPRAWRMPVTSEQIAMLQEAIETIAK